MTADALSQALAGALVEYGCTADPAHVHCLTIPEVAVSVGSTRGILFGDVACPICQSEKPGAQVPPSRFRGIWWEIDDNSKRARLAETARRYPPGSRMPTPVGATFPAPPEGWPWE